MIENRPTGRTPRALALALVGGLPLGCAGADDALELERLGTLENPLASVGQNYWPEGSLGRVPVAICHRPCRDSFTAQQCADARDEIERSIRTFAQNTRITLPAEIAECPRGSGQNLGTISVFPKLASETPPGIVHWRLRQSDGTLLDDKDNVGYSPDFETHMSTRTNAKRIIRHEFGHALGFSHEYLRNDDPANVSCVVDGEDLNEQDVSTSKVTPYDHASIMNSTYCHTNSELSPYDIVGLQTIYGAPHASGFVNERFGSCLTSSLALGECEDHLSRKITYNRSVKLGTSGGIHRSDTSTVLNEVGTRVQWNSNVTPNDNPSAAWRLDDAKLVTMGGLCTTSQGRNRAVTLEACGTGANQTWSWDLISASNQYRVISARDASLCLGVSGSQLQSVPCNNRAAIKMDLGQGRLRTGTGCLAVDGASPKEGSTLRVTSCGSGLEQRFWVRARLVNAQSGRCLTATSATEPLVTTSCSNGSSKRWDYHP